MIELPNRPLLALILLLTPAGLAAQPTARGLSGVRAASHFNENLVFFVPEAGEAFGFALAAGDFNGDGADDLATGIPGDRGYVGDEMNNAGMVVVRAGAVGSGLAGGTASTVISQYLPGYPHPPHADVFFGTSFAVGDLNGDGYDDLSVLAPLWWIFGYNHYGAATGIDVLPAGHFFHGKTAAMGNFNGDGYDDFVHADPGYDCGSASTLNGGGAGMYFGGPAGAPNGSGLVVVQGYGGLADTCEAGDAFGARMVAGDFNGDGDDDLAISAPGEDGTGAVVLALGSPTGLILNTSAILRQTDLPGGATFEAGDRFGESLATGDFDGDGYDDLAIGIPGESLAGAPPIVDAGQVSVLFGSGGGGVFDFAKTRHLFGGIDEGEFGYSLAAGDFDNDGNDDLAVGMPWGLGPTSQRQGNVWVYYGEPTVVSPFGRYRALTPGGATAIPPGIQTGMEWGLALTVGDFDADGHDDLVVGAPRFDLGFLTNVGATTVLYGSLFSDGFESQSTEHWIGSPL